MAALLVGHTARASVHSFNGQCESRVRNSRIGLAMAHSDTHGAALLASRVGSEFTVTCSSDAPKTTLLRSVRHCCEARAVTGRGRSQITHCLPWWMLDLLAVWPLYPPHPKPAEGFRWTRTRPNSTMVRPARDVGAVEPVASRYFPSRLPVASNV
jgi:hypothetical protein